MALERDGDEVERSAPRRALGEAVGAEHDALAQHVRALDLRARRVRLGAALLADGKMAAHTVQHRPSVWSAIARCHPEINAASNSACAATPGVRHRRRGAIVENRS